LVVVMVIVMGYGCDGEPSADHPHQWSSGGPTDRTAGLVIMMVLVVDTDGR
jgi:hypothetical protein